LRKIAVIGIDGTPPSLLFDDTKIQLPVIRSLTAHGVWGPLRSTDPPITIPAWTSMTTGLDPGQLGLYGFRNRFSHEETDLQIANAAHVSAERLWTMFEEYGGRSVVIGVPQTYPPSGGNGVMIAGFPVPDGRAAFTHPPDAAHEAIVAAGGAYLVDVEGFRSLDRRTLINELHRMTEARFKATRHFALAEPWTFLMMVEIATDRLHHAFWNRCSSGDANGTRYELNSVISDYYGKLDLWIGSLLGVLDDSTTVFVVSDHGAKENRGAVAVNEWLLQQGFLTLNAKDSSVPRLTRDVIDWPRTLAWAEGGYYARIFLNVRGRESFGAVEPADYESVRAEIAERLLSLRDETGRPIPVKVLKPEDIYREVKNAPPDLMVYFDDLYRRASAAVGHGAILVPGDDIGPDAANHDMDGVFIMTRMEDLRHGRKKNVRVEDFGILDIAPTALHEAGLPVPSYLPGAVFDLEAACTRRVTEAVPPPPVVTPEEEAPSTDMKGYSREEEELILKRLADLGYV
jgi:predicted AlkP superfamily phosphohydrolase/phosphomutase